jgi:hypothetical protein
MFQSDSMSDDKYDSVSMELLEYKSDTSELSMTMLAS